MNSIIFWQVLAAAIIASAPQASAGFVDGNTLHAECEGPTGSYGWYVLGAIDGLLTFSTAVTEDGEVVKTRQFICFPGGVLSEQMYDLACKYVKDHPESRHLGASLLVYEAARSAFPCK